MLQWALLSPRPNPRQFSSKSSSALYSAPAPTPRGPPSPPPSLQPLVFTAVEFPLYRLSPPASPVRSRSAPGRQRTASPCTPERAASARTHSGRRDSNHGLVPSLLAPAIVVSEPPDMDGPSRIPAILRRLTQKRPPADNVAHTSLLAPLTKRLSRSLSNTSMSTPPRPHLARRPRTAHACLDAPGTLDHVRQPAPTHPRAPSACDSACDDNVIAASLSFAAPGPAHPAAAAPLPSSSHSAQNLIPEMVHSRSYSAQDARVSYTPATPTTATATTPAPSSARQRTAPSSWAPPIAQGYSASEDGHASASPEARVGVSRNRSFGALARTWRRLSASRRSSPERSKTMDTDKRAPLIDDPTPTRQGSSHEGSRMVQSLDGGRPDMHMLLQVEPAGRKGQSAKLTKTRPVSGTAVPAIYIPPPPSYPTGTSAATSTATARPRNRTVSQGKLTKPRPPPPAEPSPRRAKFTLETGSDLDLPAAVHTSPPTPTRPPLRRNTEHLDADPDAPGRRRWTLRRAMADEAISDAGLVRELERMRAVGAWERARIVAAGRDVGAVVKDEAEKWDIDTGLDVWLDREGMLERERALNEGGEAGNGGSIAELGAPATSEWLAAQRVLLVCRELLLTEKRYLALMEALLAGATATPPPPLMLHYASDVVRASTLVLEGMTRAPGAAGIARAYLAHREVVEAAYVRWCGAVGGWFVPGEGDAAQVVRKKRSRTAVATANEGEEVAPGPALRRSANGWRRSSLGAVAAPLEEERTAPRPHAVRDLAILPTQRVTRYVLLYRDLLAHTPPTSPARVLVERAVAAASRVAEKCDRAQGNAAFIAQAPAAGRGAAGAVRAGSGASSSSRASTASGGWSGSSHASSARSSTVASSAATTPDVGPVLGEGKPLPLPPPPTPPLPMMMTMMSAVAPGPPRSQTTPLPLHPPPPMTPTSSTTLRGRRLAKRPGTGGDGASAARAALGDGSGARRTSMSAVSLSIMTSMGLRARGGRYGTPPASAID